MWPSDLWPLSCKFSCLSLTSITSTQSQPSSGWVSPPCAMPGNSSKLVSLVNLEITILSSFGHLILINLNSPMWLVATVLSSIRAEIVRLRSYLNWEQINCDSFFLTFYTIILAEEWCIYVLCAFWTEVNVNTIHSTNSYRVGGHFLGTRQPIKCYQRYTNKEDSSCSLGLTV